MLSKNAIHLFRFSPFFTYECQVFLKPSSTQASVQHDTILQLADLGILGNLVCRGDMGYTLNLYDTNKACMTLVEQLLQPTTYDSHNTPFSEH